MDLNKFDLKKGVIHCSPMDDLFERSYLEVRTKEKRVLEDMEVKILPETLTTNPNSKEWNLRKTNSSLFIKYLNSNSKTILDLGCGNGWFSNLISKVDNTEVYAIDMNRVELEQAARVFQNSKLHFIYKNIFDLQEDFQHKFDIVVLNASAQYFSDFRKLIDSLKFYLKPGGEIHVLDSFFYKENEIKKAKLRSDEYYDELGCPKMKNYYHHHSLEEVSEFEIMNNKSILEKLFSLKKTPFTWYKRTI